MSYVETAAMTSYTEIQETIVSMAAMTVTYSMAALVMIAESLDMTEIDVASTEIERLRREIDELHSKVNSDANQRHRFDNDSIV